MLSRRDFIRWSAGVGLLAAASLETACGLATATAQPQDGEILNRILGLEDLLSDFWKRSLPALRSATDASGLVKVFQAEDLSHIDLLEASLTQLGVARTERRSFDYPEGTFDTPSATLRQAVQLATLSSGAYLAAAGRLRAGSLRGLCAAIGSVEGRHRVLLRRLGGSIPVMDAAFETAGNLDTVGDAVKVFYRYA